MQTLPSPSIGSREDTMRRGLRGTLVALLVFAVSGTVTAVWANPLFVRMTPVGGWELPATALLAVLAGLSAALWVSSCRIGGAGGGGVLGFLGIACPTCNKILVLIFGGEALLAWFDPLRPYLTALGLVLMAAAVRTALVRYRSARGAAGQTDPSGPAVS